VADHHDRQQQGNQDPPLNQPRIDRTEWRHPTAGGNAVAVSTSYYGDTGDDRQRPWCQMVAAVQSIEDFLTSAGRKGRLFPSFIRCAAAATVEQPTRGFVRVLCMKWLWRREVECERSTLVRWCGYGGPNSRKARKGLETKATAKNGVIRESAGWVGHLDSRTITLSRPRCGRKIPRDAGISGPPHDEGGVTRSRRRTIDAHAHGEPSPENGEDQKDGNEPNAPT